jgi:hypothetical protein
MNPWTDGPRELLQHAADHLHLGGDFDRRIAMISVDNAVEIAIKTYLGLPERARGTKGPGRKEIEAASESFPGLLEVLDRHASEKLTGVDLNDIEWYHRLRNQLYHSGNGITVEKARVEAYFQIAALLFENLFGVPPRIDDSSAVDTKAGEFMRLWNVFEHGLRAKLPPKDTLAYYWKRDFLVSVSAQAVASWEALRQFRNNLIHSADEPSASELESRIRDLRNLMSMIGLDSR